MQAKFYKTALTLDQKHSILMNSPLALCHDFFGGFIVALACVALWRGGACALFVLAFSGGRTAVNTP